jgi:lipopolysaccharide/colanic/teichoic acid biosynthesis glycosyltransferase
MVSFTNSHDTMPEYRQLVGANVAWQPLHSRAPMYRHRFAPATLHGGWRDTAKRGFDVSVALLALALHLPLLLIAAIAIRLDSPGPVLFRQRRIGLHGQTFELLKFRTMNNHPYERGRLQQTCPGDPRVTRIGAVLRQTSIDELPQLWNVVRGEMSLVGPRPHASGTCAGGTLFEDVSERYSLRHQVRPGMTGLAQVRGWRGQTDTEEKLLRRLDSDLEYISRSSLWLDCIILARTAATVLHMRNAY